MYDFEINFDEIQIESYPVEFEPTKHHCPFFQNLTSSLFGETAAEMRLNSSLAT